MHPLKRVYPVEGVTIKCGRYRSSTKIHLQSYQQITLKTAALHQEALRLLGNAGRVFLYRVTSPLEEALRLLSNAGRTFPFLNAITRVYGIFGQALRLSGSCYLLFIVFRLGPVIGMPDRRSRSRSRSPRRGEDSTGREERKRERKKRTGWDVGADEGSAAAGAAGLGGAGFGLTQALAQQQGNLLMQNLGKGVQPAATTQLLGLGAGTSLAALQNTALMQNQRNMKNTHPRFCCIVADESVLLRAIISRSIEEIGTAQYACWDWHFSTLYIHV
eukprot:XP_028351023.1 uncharacterized protein LOC114487063 [Physeter catodon]